MKKYGGGSSLPEVTSSDNGKALGVVEGEWGKMDIPTELPAVTSSDEGKVLTVNSSGEWDAESASAGDIVKIEVTIGSGGKYMFLLTGLKCSDVYNMIQNEKKVVIFYEYNSSGSKYYYHFANSEGGIKFYSINIYPGNEQYYVSRYTLGNNSNDYLTRNDYFNGAMVPSVTSSDEGKVLSVNSSGDWVAQTPSGGKITLICDSAGGGKYNLPNNMTQQDVKTMLDNGSEIEVKIIITTGVDRIFRRCYLNNNTYEFLTMYYESNKFYASYFKIENNNNTQIELLTNNISN